MLVDFVLGFARRGRFIALIVLAVLFGAVGLVNYLLPGNPLGEASAEIKAGLETILAE